MQKENNKIVIVVGAGASFDFVATEEKKLNENHGDIKFEIWKNNLDSKDLNTDKNAQYFLSENSRKNYSFPSGDALIKMIGNSRKIFDIFVNEILDEIYNDVIDKIDWNKHCQNDNINNINNEKFLKYFFEYLKNPIYQNQQDSRIDFFSFDESFGLAIKKYFDKIGAIKTMYDQSQDEFEIKKFSDTEDFLIFIKDYPDVRKLPDINRNEIGRNFLNEVLRENFKIEISQLEESEYSQTKELNKKISSLFDDILKISTSRHLQISRLVSYYQPFSIDELLDSIKTEKIDVLKPLQIKDLKTILKSDEPDQKKLEKQFRNELIDAGKTLIALFLLRSEKKDLFDNTNPEINSKIWYRHIRNLIINSGKNPEEIKQQIKNLTIISFNYDRSLDYYLRTRLSDYYQEIKEQIIYPYGKLAVDDWDLNEYGSFDRNKNPYDNDELEKIKKLGQGLRVIGELDQENINTVNKNLKEALYESHKIYFLGFAFHQQNCDLLQLENFKINKEIYWTNYDDSISINRKIENIFRVHDHNKKSFYPSIKKGVYDALIHDFKLEFE